MIIPKPPEGLGIFFFVVIANVRKIHSFGDSERFLLKRDDLPVLGVIQVLVAFL